MQRVMTIFDINSIYALLRTSFSVQ